MSGPQLRARRLRRCALLLDIVGDPARLDGLMQQLEQRTDGPPGVDVRVGAFLNMLRGLAEYVGAHEPRASSIRR